MNEDDVTTLFDQQDEQRDYLEESYNRNLCPGCDHSPCIAGTKGACMEDER